jgi:protease I
MVVAQKDFADQEYSDPRAVFEKEGASVVLCSTTTRPAVSHNGFSLKPRVSTADLTPDQFDAIVLVGGMGAVNLLVHDEPLRKLLVAANGLHKVIAAICVAPVVLARAGIIKGVTATCYSNGSTISYLKSSGANYVDKAVVVSGNIVTGNGPDAAREFATQVLAVLRG